MNTAGKEISSCSPAGWGSPCELRAEIPFQRHKNSFTYPTMGYVTRHPLHRSLFSAALFPITKEVHPRSKKCPSSLPALGRGEGGGEGRGFDCYRKRTVKSIILPGQFFRLCLCHFFHFLRVLLRRKEQGRPRSDKKTFMPCKFAALTCSKGSYFLATASP